MKRFSILRGTKDLFIQTRKYIKEFCGTTQTDSWKSNGMSKEKIEKITKSDSKFANFVHHYLLSHITFNGYCLTKIIFPFLKK